MATNSCYIFIRIQLFMIRSALLWMLILIGSSGLWAQTSPGGPDDLDSYQDSPANTFTKLYQMSEELEHSDPVKSMDFMEEAFLVAQSMQDSSKMALALQTMGLRHKEQGYFGNAVDNTYQALSLYEEIGDMKSVAVCRHLLAAIYKDQQDFERSKIEDLESLRLCQEYGDTILLNIFTSLATSYSSLGDYEKALQTHDKALLSIPEDAPPRSYGVVYLNIAVTYTQKEEFDSAMVYYRKASRSSKPPMTPTL